MKRLILAVIVVFVAWQVLDFVLHGLILMKTYQETASLWRPMEEMKRGVMMLVCLVAATSFVVIYAGLVHTRSVATGLKYGLIFGAATGASMGFGSYSFLPIPLSLAFAWFIGSLVEYAVAGLLVGWIVKEADEKA